VAMFRNAFIESQAKGTKHAYHVFYGDPEKIRSETAASKKRSTLNFADLCREAGTDDPTHIEDPDYNDPQSHYASIVHVLLWGLQEPQIPSNRAWHMLIFLRISEGFRQMVESATWGTIAKAYFEGSTTVTGETIRPFDLR